MRSARDSPLRSFVGRQLERQRLEALLPSPSRPRATVAVILGVAGIGKTRLADALVAGAAANSIRVVRGGAYELDDPLPYALLTDLFAQWVREDPVVTELARDRQLVGELGRLVPQFAVSAAPLQRLSAQDERFRLLEAAALFFRTAARDQPLLVVMEDVHWADRDSWSMLRYVARAMRERPVLFVLTARVDERDSEPAGLTDLAREMDVERVVLRPLDLDGAARMLESLSGERLPTAIVQAIHRESGGNPFYLRHVFEHLVEEGKLKHLQGRWSTEVGVDELGIPPGVRPLLMRRIGRLSEGAAAMLRLASIYPDHFDVARLRALSDGGEDRFLEHLDESLDVGVIVARENGYAFAHTLLRRALRDAMSSDRRARLHRRAAEQLARVGDDPGEIARQYHASRRLEGARVGVEFALRAAERAASARLDEHRAAFLRIAVDLQGEHVATESLRDLALAQAAALDIEAAEFTAQRLVERVDCASSGNNGAPPWMLDFLASLVRRLKDAGATPSVWLPFVKLGVDLCGDRRDLAWARLAVLRPRWHLRWVGLVCETVRIPLDPVARDLLQRLGDEDDIAETLDPFEARTKERTEAVRDLANRWRSAAAIIRARDVVARDWSLRHGDMPRASETLAELAADSLRLGSLPGRAEAYAGLVIVEAMLGRMGASEDAHREARQLIARLGPSHRLNGYLDVAVVPLVTYMRGGDLEALREPARRALQSIVGQQVPVGLWVLTVSAMVEALARGSNNYEERIDALLASLERTAPDVYLANRALYFGVTALHERGDVKRAPRFERLVREARAQDADDGPFGNSLELALGLLASLQGKSATARKHFAEARASFDRASLPWFRAVVELEDARVAGALGDVGAWHASLEQARSRFDALGLPAWSERVRALEEAGLGGIGRNPHAEGPDGLSPREMEVLGRLAAGGSAKTIASDLGLSVATAKRHVANVYAKIGVNSRAAATAYALKHGIGQG
jgi:DNA-binding CsgD family transcriptional regulator